MNRKIIFILLILAITTYTAGLCNFPLLFVISFFSFFYLAAFLVVCLAGHKLGLRIAEDIKKHKIRSAIIITGYNRVVTFGQILIPHQI